MLGAQASRLLRSGRDARAPSRELVTAPVWTTEEVTKTLGAVPAK